MSREWVVVIRGDWYLRHLVNMLQEYRGNSEQTRRDEVIEQIESQIVPDPDGEMLVTTRPLVVIDPEDRKQVERLIGLYHDQRCTLNDHNAIDDLQAALREFANPTPPKPDEPQGLGAVVEDRWGHRFVMVAADGGRWWNVNEDQGCTWDHIDAVRVLSEGVAQP